MRSSYLPALVLLGLSAIIVLGLTLAPGRSGTQLAVIYPLSGTFEQNFSLAVSAGARVVRSGATSNILIVDAGNADALYHHGAWLVMNAVIEGDCILSPRRDS